MDIFWQYNIFAQIIYGNTILWTNDNFFTAERTSNSCIHKIVRLVHTQVLWLTKITRAHTSNHSSFKALMPNPHKDEH